MRETPPSGLQSSISAKWRCAFLLAINSKFFVASATEIYDVVVDDDDVSGSCLLQKRAAVVVGVSPPKPSVSGGTGANTSLLQLHARSSEKLLYVGIMSAPENAEQRATVRQLYLDKLRQESADDHVHAEFLIGHTPYTYEGYQQGAHLNEKQIALELGLDDEAKTHGDIRRIPLPESYMNLPDKTLQLFQHGVEMGYKFVLKIDDDLTLDVARAEEWAKSKDPSDLIYAGSSLFDKKVYESQLGQKGMFNPYFAGPCYLLSWKLAHHILDVHSQHTLEFTSYGSSSEDVDMGHWVAWEKQLGERVQYEKLTDLIRDAPPTFIESIETISNILK